MTYFWLGSGPVYPLQPESDGLCGECKSRPSAWGDWLCTQCRERLEATRERPGSVECPACGGQGVVFPGAEVCDLCGGDGEVDPMTAARWEEDRWV